jgi:sugar/nucleoside kinase (ribokinase family)
VFDPNLRPARWRTGAEAAAAANAAVPGAFLVRTNRAEAEAMTGEPDPERAAAALLAGGARLVVVTLGADGALLRGDLESDVPGVRARVRSTVGAGDALMGVLLARLSLAGFHVPALAAALPEAVAEAARATERWGAVE